MKRFYYRCLFLIAALSSLTGCSVSDLSTDNQSEEITGNRNFYATIEGNDNATKVYFDEEIRLRWNEEDLITVFDGTTRNKKYIFLGKDGDNCGEFDWVKSGFGAGNDINCNCAVYPYASTTRCVETNSGDITYIKYNLSATQVYKEKSAGKDANVMVAVTANDEDTDLKFKNVCSYLCVKLYGAAQKVGSIVFQGNNNEAITGEAAIVPVYGGEPSLSVNGTGTTITLECEEGVTVGTTKEDATEFWIVVPPLTYSEGYKVTVNGYNGGSQTFVISGSRNFVRNKYNTLTRELTVGN